MVSKLRMIRWIGVVLLFVPFFGVPSTWKAGITIVLGGILIYMSFALKRAYKRLKFELRQGAVPVADQSDVHAAI